MTDYLLKNKKLLNEDITTFIYNNEAFSNKLTNINTLFKLRYTYKDINLRDKVDVYKFSKENKNNINILKNVINDFITLLKFLNNKRKEGNNIENDISEESKIYEVIDKIKDQFSPYFIKIFENNDGLTIDKTSSIFDFYLKLVYENAMKEIKDYQVDLDDESIKVINEYYQQDQKKLLISKKDFSCALRLFITLILLPEEDKEKKIKSNRNNVVNYLKSSDLWKEDIYNSEDFNKTLNELKLINAQINQIIQLYEILGKDIEDNFIDDIKEEIGEKPPAKKDDVAKKNTEDNNPSNNNSDIGNNEDDTNDNVTKNIFEKKSAVDNDNDDDEEEEDPFAKKEQSDDDGDDSD